MGNFNDKPENKILMFKLNKTYEFDKFIILMSLIIIFRFFSSYYLPINIIAGAPHDDTLFYSLGKNLSDLNWLGDYNNLTLIKGPIFPLFLSISMKLGIPLRLWETFLICSSVIYFVSSLQKFQPFKKYFAGCMLILIIFDAFQYFSISFRILRETIYPWLLLLVVTQIIIIFSKTLNPPFLI